MRYTILHAYPSLPPANCQVGRLATRGGGGTGGGARGWARKTARRTNGHKTKCQTRGRLPRGSNDSSEGGTPEKGKVQGTAQQNVVDGVHSVHSVRFAGLPRRNFPPIAILPGPRFFQGCFLARPFLTDRGLYAVPKLSLDMTM